MSFQFSADRIAIDPKAREWQPNPLFRGFEGWQANPLFREFRNWNANPIFRGSRDWHSNPTYRGAGSMVSPGGGSEFLQIEEVGEKRRLGLLEGPRPKMIDLGADDATPLRYHYYDLFLEIDSF